MSGLPFSAPVRAWFEATFAAPTPVQRDGWTQIAAGRHAVLLAPTGSGKTLAAFLWALDWLHSLPVDAPAGVRVVYVSPLKALAYDVERNLRAPLVGIQRFSERDGAAARPPRVAIRTGDTSAKARRQQAREPAEILVTTPESLFLILSSKAAETLRTVHTVIVDEVHAVAGTKRGAHLALSLERLAALTEVEPQRIGLSATIEPPAVAARFLGGTREVAVVDTVSRPLLDLKVCVPVPDMERAAAARVPAGGPLLAELAGREAGPTTASGGIWETLYPAILAEIEASRSTIVFVNSRALAERLAQRLNELADAEVAWAHHGSVSHAKRARIEEGLKAGEIRAIVATSTMELGVDMGAVDRVILVESPGAVSRGLQRVGRAGHQVGVASAGRIYPKFRGDLLEATVVAERMLTGAIEPTAMPRNPLDVLAQQVAAMCCNRTWGRAELAALVRRAGPFATLGDAALDAVLEMLSGKYAALGSLELRPRISWDRAADRLSERRGTAMLVRANAGTIPDRGLYAVHLGPDGPRLGELDEEMVFESRVGEVFALGASSWRIENITRDRVIVSPAPGEPGKLPFWRGDGPGRPVTLGAALGATTRELAATDAASARARLLANGLLEPFAADNLVAYVHEQLAHCGAVPSDRTVVVERFRDELGDWRVCILSPFGARVHAPWAMALERTLGADQGYELQVMYADDGVVVRFADAEALPPLAALFPAPDMVETLVIEQLVDTARFAGLFRENAARSLLLPRRRPNARSPLWAQRLKSAELLARVRDIEDFPILLETYREALRDAFDMPALRELLSGVAAARIAVHEVETQRASPFARSLVFAYVAAYIYDQDAPLAERRAQALSLDRGLLAELIGSDALRELIDADVLARIEAVLQCLDPDYAARDADELHDLLLRLGDLSEAEIGPRVMAPARAADWLATLAAQGRAVQLRIGGAPRWIAAQDAGLYRDALGCLPPSSLPAAHLAPIDDALAQLVGRFARRRGPFAAEVLAVRYDLSPGQVQVVLRLLETRGVLVHGEMRPDGVRPEWCDAEVARRVKRETLAHLRQQVAPVEANAVAGFLPRWQNLDPEPGRRPATADAVEDALLDTIEQLQGVALPWSLWRDQVLPRRVHGFALEALERQCAMGQVVWVGRGAAGPRDGRVAFYLRERLPLLWEPLAEPHWAEPLSEVVLAQLTNHGACFRTELEHAVLNGREAGREDFDSALRELLWAGAVTNDTLAPLQALAAGGRPRARRGGLGLRGVGVRRTRTGAGGRWSALTVPGVPAGAATAAAGDARRRRPDAARSAAIHRAAVARAEMLLARYGIVSREMALADGLKGGFASVYAVLKTMEEGGRVRRGYFVDGLSGAQFAVPGAVEMLREMADERTVRAAPPRLLATLDPANPYGAVLPWPAVRGAAAMRPRRAAGTWLVTAGAGPVLYLAPASRAVLTFAADAVDEALLTASLRLLATVPRGSGRQRLLTIETIDGDPVERSACGDALRAAGFVNDYRGYSAVS